MLRPVDGAVAVKSLAAPQSDATPDRGRSSSAGSFAGRGSGKIRGACRHVDHGRHRQPRRPLTQSTKRIRRRLRTSTVRPNAATLREWYSESPSAARLSTQIAAWLAYLGQERRLAGKTLEAYGRDVRQFTDFLGARLSRAPDANDFAALKPADLARLPRGPARGRHRRAFAATGALGAADRWQNSSSALARAAPPHSRRCARRRPGRRLPRPLRPDDARAVADVETRAGETREPWVLARDAAVLALCYGAGLRISEALSESPAATRRSARSTKCASRQGRQDPHRPDHRAGPRGDRGLSRALSRGP